MQYLIPFTLLLFSALPGVADDSALERASIAISIHPVETEEYVCDIKMTDRESGEPIASPKLRLTRGETATLKLGEPNGDAALEVQVKIDSAETFASVRISSTKAGVEKVFQQTEIRLRP